MLAFLKLIRFPNLLIVAFTQYLMRYTVILPILANSGASFQFSDFHFFLLSLSTVLIAAGGYVINDYFDTKTDRINRPESVIIDKMIKRRVAIGAHVVINVIGILIGFYLGFKAGMWKLGFIHLLSAIVLWFYSTNLKREFLVGNIVVSLLTAMVPLIVAFYDLPLLNRTYHDLFIETHTDQFILKFIGAFSLFAFLVSLIREIIKDMEDTEGDKAMGCVTLPIAWGIRNSKLLVALLCVITFSLLVIIQYSQWNKSDSHAWFYYLVVAIQLPLLYIIFALFNAKTARHYHNVSMVVKGLMLTGVLFSLYIFKLLMEVNAWTYFMHHS